MQADFPTGPKSVLTWLQKEAFDYFVNESNPDNGLVRDKNAPDWPASIAAVGLALSAYPVAVERGFIERDEAAAKVVRTLQFFRDSVQGMAPDATGYRGFYYHFLDINTGRRARKCELSTVDTALLLAGALMAGAYFNRPDERDIPDLANLLYARADWQWACNGGDTVTLGWKPERGFLPYRWKTYSEALLLYILALGSPTFPLPAASYQAWCSGYQWRTVYGIDYLHCGPLFTHQLPHLWIDFRSIQDEAMRKKGIDYFENSRRATLIQQRYAIDNPQGFAGYGEYCWGITASDGPGPCIRTGGGVKRRFYDYIARGVPDGPDDGTLAPWAVIAALPFAPEIVLPTIDHLMRHPALTCRYGFRSTFNLTFSGSLEPADEWRSPWHFGIDQGPIVIMIDNHVNGLPWRLMRGCEHVVRGLRRCGFGGGWLDQLPAGEDCPPM